MSCRAGSRHRTQSRNAVAGCSRRRRPVDVPTQMRKYGPAHVSGIRPWDTPFFAVDGAGCDPPVPTEFGIGRSHLLTIASGTNLDSREVRVDVPIRKASKQRPPLVEPKPVSYRMMDRDIGYLKVLYFPGAAGLRFAGILDDAMSALKTAGCRGLILDLRGNIGGSLGFARLASYLCSKHRGDWKQPHAPTFA